MQRTTNTTLALLALVSLTACGGGGGGSAFGNNPNGPTVNAGTDTTVAERDTVTLTGTATENPTGGAIATFLWTQTGGSPVALMESDQIRATFVAADLGNAGPQQLTFRFTATDAVGQASSDEVMVMVQDARSTGGVVVYAATMNSSNQMELFSTDTRGVHPSIMVSGGVQHANNSTIDGFWISPDERWVAYSADERIDNLYELFIARTDGSGSTVAHGALTNSDEIVRDSLRWSPIPDPTTGEHRLAFVADLATNRHELYTVQPGTSAPVKVSAPFTSSIGRVRDDIEWANDGSRIAYRADAGVNGLIELYTALPDTATNTIKVSGTLQSLGDVHNFEWSARGDQIAYVADALIDGRNELFVSGATSSGATRVSQSLAFNRDVLSYAWTPDSAEEMPRIAYRADANTNSVVELYSTTADGTDIVRESGPMVNGGDVHSIFWSPDGNQIAYVADQLQNNVAELFIAAPGSLTTTTRLSGELTTNGNVVTSSVFWSPTSEFIAYVADQRQNGVRELFVSATDGSSNLRASGAMTGGGDVSNAEKDVSWSPSSDRIAYRADQNQDESFQIFTSSPTTGFESNTVVSGRPVPGGSVDSAFAWSRDGGRLIYISDQDMNDVFELWSTGRDFEPSTAAENPKLSGALPSDANGDVTWFDLSGRD